MADDKKTISPDVGTPTETPEQPNPAPDLADTTAPAPLGPEELTVEEQLILEHEGQAALFEMGEAVPDPADAVTHTEVEKPTAPEVPKAEKEQEQPPDPGKDDPTPAHSGKVVNFAAARDEAAKDEKKVVKQKPPAEKDKAAKPGRGRPSKDGKASPDKAKPSKPRDKKSQSKPIPEKPAVDKGGAPAGTEVTPEPSAPRDATRAEKEEIVYLNLSDLHPFKNHPFGVRDDAEMQGLVESVKAAGVNQPALVRPREDGGYEIIAGHRRQRASELAGFANMPCIVRNMTDDEAILAMTDDNLRHRERILPTEKAQSLKMQVEAIKHQGSRPGEEDKDAGKRSTQVVGDRNGMNYKQVQRYIRLTELVPDLQKMVDEKKLAFTPAVEISFIRPKNQRYMRSSRPSCWKTAGALRWGIILPLPRPMSHGLAMMTRTASGSMNGGIMAATVLLWNRTLRRGYRNTSVFTMSVSSRPRLPAFTSIILPSVPWTWGHSPSRPATPRMKLSTTISASRLKTDRFWRGGI